MRYRPVQPIDPPKRHRLEDRLNLITALRTCLLEKYGVFHGRAARAEYWWYMLLMFAIAFVIEMAYPNASKMVSPLSRGNWLYIIATFALLLPSVSVTVRRLHDLDKPTLWVLINLIPYIGWIIMLILCARRGTTGWNTYGADPLNPELPAPIDIKASALERWTQPRDPS